ncbi:MAG: group II intron reverse transcriptase/maturase [Deltaproteobacteria bacterium]|nr:group II intron reverse transcriptase/maturase [Deltaproteobacteria bacterium]
MPTSLQGIAEKARSQKQYRFRNLYGMLNEELLTESWREIKKSAASGVDQISAQDYEQNLEGNIRDLVERLKQKRYRAKLVKRHYIPKGNGKLRPLGIPAVEDKLLQVAATRLLAAIYEQDFLPCSYGYRPGVGALEAVDDLTVKLQFGRYSYVVEADIKGFFDNLDHHWMIRMLEERVEDRAFLGLIRKWLRAGILDTTGAILHPVTGTPQGGVVSPVLSNVYLHYVLDLWFEKVVKPRCRGEACLLRYADDYVCAFEYQEEAERFYAALGPRLEKFGLTLAVEKTRILPFSRQQPPGQSSFEFLGFEFRWGWDRAGKAHLKRRTARAKLRASLQRFTQWCRENRQRRLPVLFQQLNSKLRGYYQYYGVHGNSASLRQFFEGAVRILLKWLNRRSQRPSYTWQGFQAILAHFKIERPRIVGQSRRRKATALA